MTDNPCQKLQTMVADFTEYSPGVEMMLASREILDRTAESLRRTDLGALKQREVCFQKYKEYVMELLQQWDDDPRIIEKIEFEESGRVVLDGSLDLSNNRSDKSYFPAVIRKINGRLILTRNTQIKQIDYLEEVGGSLTMTGSRLESFARLKKVGEVLNLENSIIESFPSLEAVGKQIYMRDTPLKRLPALKYVLSHFHAENSALENLDSLIKVSGVLGIDGCPIKSIPCLKKVYTLKASNAFNLENLDSLEEVLNNGLQIGGTKIKSLPRLRVVVGGFDASRLYCLENCPSLKIVKGSCDLEGTAVKDLSSLEQVWDDLNLSRTKNLTTLPRLKLVNGDVDLRFSGIKSAPELYNIGGHLNLRRALPDQSFRGAFPKLVMVGKQKGGTSIMVGNPRTCAEIENLARDGKIRLTGLLLGPSYDRS